MLLGASKAGVISPFPYAFTQMKAHRQRTLSITAAVKKRPPAQRSTPKQAPSKSRSAPARKGAPKEKSSGGGLRGLFGGAKKAASQPAKAAKRAAPVKAAKKIAKKVAPAGTKRIGGTQRAGGTKRIGTKRVGGTSKIGTKRTGSIPVAAPPGRIRLDEDTSSTLGAAGVFSLGLATAAFLLFSVFTGIEGPADAEQVVSNAANSVKSAVQEVASIADSPANQEDTKIAELSNKAKEAAEKVPSAARSAPSPQVADSSPTGKAGIFGFGGQQPSAAEDTQIPNVIEKAKETVEGQNPTPTPTSTEAPKSNNNPFANLFASNKTENEVSSVAEKAEVPNVVENAKSAIEEAVVPEQSPVSAPAETPDTGNFFSNLFGSKKSDNEVSSVAAEDTAGNQEDTKIAELSNKAKEAAEKVPSAARSAPSPQVADASPTGKAGIFGFGGQQPSAAEDTQIPNVIEKAKETVEGQNPTPTPTSTEAPKSNNNPFANLFASKKADNDVAAVAEDVTNSAQSQVSDAVDSAKETVQEQSPISPPTETPDAGNFFSNLFGSKKGDNEVSSVAAEDTAGNQEDTKIAELSNKAKEAAEKVPSAARSAPSPQVADASPTGKAGIFGFGGQQPSAAEDTQIPNVIEKAKETVEGQNPTPTPTSTKAPESNNNPFANLFASKKADNDVAAVAEDVTNSAQNQVSDVVDSAKETVQEQSPISTPAETPDAGNFFSNLFGSKKGDNEVSSVAAEDTAGNQEDTKIAELSNKAKEAAEKVPSEARSAPSPQVADASPTGKAGIFGFGGQKPSAAEDTQIPNVIEKSKEAVQGNNPTPTPTSSKISSKANEVAKVAENPIEEATEKVEDAAKQVEGAAEKAVEAVEKVPSPDGLVEGAKDAAKDAAPSFRAAAPYGAEGTVSNLADQGLKGSSKFEELAAKLQGSGAEQFEKANEEARKLQEEDNLQRIAKLTGEAVDSAKDSAKQSLPTPSAPSLPSIGSSNSKPSLPTPPAPSPSNPIIWVGGGLLLAGGIAAAASGDFGSQQPSVSPPSSGKGGPSVGNSGTDSGDSGTGSSGAKDAKSGDVKDEIASRKKDAQAWIKAWKDSTGGK